jgi:hypothetical protein
VREFFVQRSRPDAPAACLAFGSRELVDDRPRGVGAELVAPGEIKVIHGVQEGEVAVADSFRHVVSGSDALLHDRDDQPQVGLDDPVLQLPGLGLQSLDFIQIGGGGAIRIDSVPDSTGEALQVVHLAEQMDLLLTRQDRGAANAGFVGVAVRGRLDPLGGLVVELLRLGGEDRVVGVRLVEAGVSDVRQLRRRSRRTRDCG